MTIFWSLERCRRYLGNRAASSDYLIARDQFPQLSGLRERIDSAVQVLLDDFKSNSEEMVSQLAGDIRDADQRLREAKQRVQESFETDPSTVPVVLSKLVTELFWPLRSRLIRRLEAPFKDPSKIDQLVSGLASVYANHEEDCPDQLLLIFGRDSGKSLGGCNIWEVEGDYLIKSVCDKPHLSIHCRAHFYWSLLGLRFKYRHVRVLLGELFRAISPNQFPGSRRELCLNRKEESETLNSRVEENWKSVRFALEVAAAELSDLVSDGSSADPWGGKLEELRRLAVEALEKGAEALPEIHSRFSRLWDGLFREVGELHLSRMAELDQRVSMSGTMSGSIWWAYRNLQNRSRRILRKVWQSMTRIGRVAKRIAFRVYLELEDLLLGAAVWMGMSRQTRQDLLSLADLPRHEQLEHKLEGFPPVYRRLFSTEALRNPEFLVHRDGEFQLLKEAVERFRQGRRANVVISGQIGTGKTSLIQCFLASEYGTEIEARTMHIQTRIDSETDFLSPFSRLFDDNEVPKSVEQLIEGLREQPPQVVIVEQAHRLMLRVIGGRRGIEMFHRVMLATRDRVLWVLTVREHPFKLMDRQFSMSQFFTHEIQTRFVGEAALREAILLRHQSSSCKLRYLSEGITDRKLKKLRSKYQEEAEQVQAYLERKFFETLFAATGGNMFAAIYFWLLSTEFNEGSGVIQIKACSKPDVSVIQTFDTLSQYTLAEILHHGELTVDEHARVFLVPRARSLTVLNHLSYLRLIETTEETGESFSINPVLVNPIISTLRSINVLY